MTAEAWSIIMPKLWKSISKLRVLRDHPEWCVLLSLYVYGSQVKFTKALKIFTLHNIHAVKEEGDASHFNQTYEQFFVKEDKQHMHTQPNTVPSALGQPSINGLIFMFSSRLRIRLRKRHGLLSSEGWICTLIIEFYLINGSRFIIILDSWSLRN